MVKRLDGPQQPVPYEEDFLAAVLRAQFSVPKLFFFLPGIKTDDAMVLAFLVNEHEGVRNAGKLKDDRWFYCTHEKMTREINVSSDRQTRIVAKLKDAGFIATKLIGIPSKRYFRINFGALEDALRIVRFEGRVQSQSAPGSAKTRNLHSAEERNITNTINTGSPNGKTRLNNGVPAGTHLTVLGKSQTPSKDEQCAIRLRKVVLDATKAAPSWLAKNQAKHITVCRRRVGEYLFNRVFDALCNHWKDIWFQVYTPKILNNRFVEVKTELEKKLNIDFSEEERERSERISQAAKPRKPTKEERRRERIREREKRMLERDRRLHPEYDDED